MQEKEMPHALCHIQLWCNVYQVLCQGISLHSVSCSQQPFKVCYIVPTLCMRNSGIALSNLLYIVSGHLFGKARIQILLCLTAKVCAVNY